jgi:sugar lactone lactonase YvrE
MEMSLPVRQVLAADCLLGEGALWDAARAIVWFVDIKRQRLWHFDPATGSNGFTEAPAPIGWAIPAQGGLVLCGLKDGLYTFAPESDAFTKLCAVPGEPASNRLNDACTDPWGRVWFGSMDDAESAASGRFYVFDRGEVRPAGPEGIAITNGPAVNAAGTRIYFTDTLAQKIFVADLSAAGAGPARLFADTGALFPKAYPDGPVVDAEGHVWTGLYHGGCVARFAPDGTLVATVPIPARDITKLAFGGTDLKTAYVTTATKNMSQQDMAEQPLAGSLFAFAAPVAGFAQAPVRLT